MGDRHTGMLCLVIVINVVVEIWREGERDRGSTRRLGGKGGTSAGPHWASLLHHYQGIALKMLSAF